MTLADLAVRRRWLMCSAIPLLAAVAAYRIPKALKRTFLPGQANLLLATFGERLRSGRPFLVASSNGKGDEPLFPRWHAR
jgi:hypothetical protein